MKGFQGSSEGFRGDLALQSASQPPLGPATLAGDWGSGAELGVVVAAPVACRMSDKGLDGNLRVLCGGAQRSRASSRAIAVHRIGPGRSSLMRGIPETHLFHHG